MNAPPKILSQRIREFEQPRRAPIPRGGAPPVPPFVRPFPPPGPHAAGEPRPVGQPPPAEAKPLPPELRARTALDRPEGPGTLPVLEAFQEFLAEERRLMRRRLRLLTAAFVAILLILTAAGIAGGVLISRTLRDRVEGVRREVSETVGETDRLNRNMRQTLSQVTDTADDLRTNMDREKRELLVLKSSLAKAVVGYTGEVGRLRDVLDAVKLENSSLRDQFAALKHTAATPLPLAAAPMATAASGPDGLPRSLADMEATREIAGFLTVEINPRGDEAPRTFRLPLPE